MTFHATALPLAATVFIHVFVVWCFTLDWKAPAERVQIKPPAHIKATLVKLMPQETRASQKKAPKKVDLTKKKKEREAKKRQEARAAEKKLALKKKQENLKREQQAEQERKKEELKKKKEQEARRKRQEDERRRQRETELQAALAQEQEQLLEQTYAEQARSYAQLIREKVEQRWSRPPSARSNMKCLLAISMVPSGMVIDVRVIESSGNSAFDRSAVRAVQKVNSFSEVRDMPVGLFEREFRNFKMLFSPEDLRQ